MTGFDDGPMQSEEYETNRMNKNIVFDRAIAIV
jgi:hypothetical protein